MKKSSWEKIGDMVLTNIYLRSILGLILLIVVCYGFFALLWGFDVLTKKDEDYVLSSDYNAYVEKVAQEHVDEDIFEVVDKPVNGPADDTVTIYYTFKKSMSIEEYETYAYEELKFLYTTFKDFKLKKDTVMVKRGKDIVLVFYTYENGEQKEIGLATMFYIFRKLSADDYISGKDKIITKS